MDLLHAFKRLFKLFLFSLVLFVLFSCGTKEKKVTYNLEVEYETTLQRGDVFDPLEGVSAFNQNNEDSSKLVLIEGLNKLKRSINGNLTEVGSFVLRYLIENGNNSVQKYRVIHVLPLKEDNLIYNSDFKENLEGWSFSTYSRNENEIILKKGDFIKQTGINIKPGKDYEVSINLATINSGVIDIEFYYNDLKLMPNSEFRFTPINSFGIYKELIHFPDEEFNNVDILIKGVSGDTKINKIEITEVNLNEDITKPEILGVEDISIVKGVTLNLLDGIRATDDFDGNITYRLNVVGPADIKIIDNKVSFIEEGEYVFEYRVSDNAGNETVAIRKITVETASPSNVELIKNIKFDNNLEYWEFSDNEGSSSTYLVDEEGALVISINTLPSQYSPFPRLVQGKKPLDPTATGITFEQGATYRLSFTVKADVQHKMLIQIGELLNGEPWVLFFTPEKIQQLGTDYETFIIEFTMMNSTNINGMVSFCFGRFNQPDQTTTKVYIKNISLKKIK